jgi:glutamine amidotransferase PdxT
LFFIVEAGIGGAMAGLLGVIAFVAGLIISNTVMCAISVGLFGASSAREPIYRIVAGVTAVYSVCAGMIFLFGASSILPPI